MLVPSDKTLLAVFLISALCSLRCLYAATYYVSKSGSNSNSCAQAQSTSASKLTINGGIGCLSAGDTLWVRAGNYDETITSVPSGTSWSNKVRIAHYPGETVWMRPSTGNAGSNVIWLDGDFHYVEFDGINLDGRPSAQNCLWTSTNNGHDPHHIRFQNAEVIAGVLLNGTAIDLGAHALIGATGANELINLTIHGGGYPGQCGFECASYGVYIQGPNNLLDGLDIYDTTGAGIQLYGGSGDAPDNNIIRNTRIHDITRVGDINQLWGIIIGGSNNQIYNNLIYSIDVPGVNNSGDGAIVVGSNRNGNKIWNNTIYNVRNSGIVIGSGAANNEVKNNIVFAVTGSHFINNGSGTSESNNLFGVDPVFVNAGGNDFHLQANSPARNTGAALSLVDKDITGAPRPQEGVYDRGAYEFGGTASPAPVISASASTATVGSSLVVSWSDIASPSALDWIGFVLQGNTAESDWRNVNCTQTPTTPVPSGSCSFQIASNVLPGTYQFKLFANNTYTVLAMSPPITITAGASTACDINQDGFLNVNDAQLAINQVLGTPPCVPFGQPGSADINRDGQCTVVDVQRVVNAALGGTCVSP